VVAKTARVRCENASGLTSALQSTRDALTQIVEVQFTQNASTTDAPPRTWRIVSARRSEVLDDEAGDFAAFYYSAGLAHVSRGDHRSSSVEPCARASCASLPTQPPTAFVPT
jgi:hypothetical protein